MEPRGQIVKLQFESTDAQTAAAVTIYDTEESVVTLSGNQRLVIESLAISAIASCQRLDFFTDSNSDGAVDAAEKLIALDLGALGTFDFSFKTDCGLYCAKALNPKVKCGGAGEITLSGVGYILNA